MISTGVPDPVEPVGSYRIPCFGYPVLSSGSYNHEVGYPPEKGYGMSLQVGLIFNC